MGTLCNFKSFHRNYIWVHTECNKCLLLPLNQNTRLPVYTVLYYIRSGTKIQYNDSKKDVLRFERRCVSRLFILDYYCCWRWFYFLYILYIFFFSQNDFGGGSGSISEFGIATFPVRTTPDGKKRYCVDDGAEVVYRPRSICSAVGILARSRQ